MVFVGDVVRNYTISHHHEVECGYPTADGRNVGSQYDDHTNVGAQGQPH